MGDGDVLISTARQPGAEFDNEVCFVRDAPHEIGSYTQKYADGQTTTADIDCPVRIQFYKPESVDVLIERLSEVRAQMGGAPNEVAEMKRQRDELSEEMERCHGMLDKHYREPEGTVSADTLEQRLAWLLEEVVKLVSDAEKVYQARHDIFTDPNAVHRKIIKMHFALNEIRGLR